MTNDVTGVRAALARAVATRNIADDVIEAAAKQIAAVKHPIRGVDVCERGICIDFFLDDRDWWKVIPELTTIGGGRLVGIETFPWGVPKPDIFHVRVTQEMEGIPALRGQGV